MPFTLAKLLTCRDQQVSRQAALHLVIIMLPIVVTVVAMRYVNKLQTVAVQAVVYESRKRRQEQLQMIDASDSPGTHEEVATVYPQVYVQRP
jgi:hypothetical protein